MNSLRFKIRIFFLLTGFFVFVSFYLTGLYFENYILLKQEHAFWGFPLSWAPLSFSERYVIKFILNGVIWSTAIFLLFLGISRVLPRPDPPTAVKKLGSVIWWLLFTVFLLFSTQLLFFRSYSFPKIYEITVSPADPKIAAGYMSRSFLQGNSLNVALLKPGLNVNLNAIRHDSELPETLQSPGPVTWQSTNRYRSLYWSEDGKRLAFVQNNWVIAAWDFEHDLFLQLQSNGDEELQVEHHFVSLLFEGRLLHYEPVDSLEKRYYDQMMSHGRVY